MPQYKAIPVPFEMCSPTRVSISLEHFWEVARAWAHMHGYRKEAGRYQQLPAT